MARPTNSNSESESRTRATTSGGAVGNTTGGARSNTKQRLTAAQQQYLKDLVKTHVTNNHPDLTPKPTPIDFESYPDQFLRQYKERFKLKIEDNMTIQGYLLGSQLGAKTCSYKKNAQSHDRRVHKKELATEVKKHFTSYGIKEAECIPQFIYKVKNQKKKFRMEFRG
ncbi:hypothetical protein HG535_0F00530 [Zygotorulaspora mrakii]|uniref:Histone deacetylase complex subunit SAP30 Sin3 binding domain-containing protein n=1 Tax=Zygotorulaspora mrakii TaxID=42260 RepID=A0A7H9B4Z4_ZYGMR|nr:uncharacterized protein HG535_0F00530 [Zygotorulaspora mrakii]QLG73543.1 hypothetical protein HG535_0F00530 [Zygotorulaspora mrakii]